MCRAENGVLSPFGGMEISGNIAEKRKIMLPKDPLMLLSYVNMKLRDNYGSLDRLCEELDVNEQEITDSLASVGYHYNKERNQFVSQG